MASIIKRGSAYSVRYTYIDHRGKKHEGWESFKTKKEASERKITIEKELQDGTFLIPDSMTVQELLEKWIPIQSSKHKWAPKTYTHTVAMVQNLIVPYIGGLQVQNVRTFDLEQFYTTLSQTPKGLYKQGKKQKLSAEQKKRHLTALILKKPKTKKSQRILYMTKPLKEELLAWLEKLKEDEVNADGRYRNCGQLFRLPNGLPVAPEALSKWYREWRDKHPEFEKIVFHGLRHSSATYQLMQSGGDFKSVQGNTGHATAATLMDTYAHTQDKPRIELAEKIEANFYKEASSPAAPTAPAEAAGMTAESLLELVRQMKPEQKREFARLLFA